MEIGTDTLYKLYFVYFLGQAVVWQLGSISLIEAKEFRGGEVQVHRLHVNASIGNDKASRYEMFCFRVELPCALL